MPGENIFDWSTTAANNDTADSLINWREGMARAAVNDSARSLMAAHAKNRDLLNGSKVTGGTPNAQTFTSGYAFTSIPTIPTGLRTLLKIGPGLTNTAAVTLNMDSLGEVPVKDQHGNDIIPGRLAASSFAEFFYNGTNWVLNNLTNINVVSQLFTSSGTYTPTVGMQFCTIECIGGGGGGGGATGAGLGTYFSGGGGGSGGYSRKTANGDAIGASQVITVGAGGGFGDFLTTSPGGAGGSTSVGTLCVAGGGSGGYPGGDTFGAGSPGGGASAGTGDLIAAGAPGGAGEYRKAPGTLDYGKSGHGGSSYFGGGAAPTLSASTAAVGGFGKNYGSGASGGSSANTSLGAGGGTGSDGVVIITEFCL